FRSYEPRVFVIASISGGTGGGMALDVAYAVRRILADLGFSGEGVCEILTHSTDRNPTAAELATANAYASLTELQHYGRFGYCPGDPACGLPPADERATLGNAYFVHLGHGLNDQEFEAATDALASYLYLNTATSAAALFDASRAQTPVDSAATSLRSFSLATIGSMHTSLAGRAAELLCREIADRWRGACMDRQDASQKSSFMEITMQRSVAPDASGANAIADLAQRHTAGLGLSLDELRRQVAALVDQQLGGDAATVLSRLATMIDGQCPPGTPKTRSTPARTRMLLESIRGLFDPTAVTEEVQRPPAVELRAALEQALKPIAAPKARAIAQWIGEFVNDPAARVAGALQARKWYAGYLRQLDTQCANLAKDFQHNLQALEQTLAETEKAAPTRGRMFGGRRVEKRHIADVDELLRLIVQMRIEECALHGAGKLARLVAAGVATAGDKLKDIQHELGQWSQQFEGPSPWEEPDDASPPEGIFDEVRAAVARDLRERMPQLVRDVDERLQATLLGPQGGLSGV
ncbi:MAG: tubulin-like doman-containing protein, partial [Pirellulales bacterium]